VHSTAISRPLGVTLQRRLAFWCLCYPENGRRRRNSARRLRAMNRHLRDAILPIKITSTDEQPIFLLRYAVETLR